MPFIKLDIDSATKEQKNELIESVTSTCSEILNMDKSAFLVLIEEHSTDDWGLGGKSVTDILAASRQQ